MVLDDALFVFGPRYSVLHRSQVCLINFLIEQVKMSIWLTRCNKMKGIGSGDVSLMIRGLVAARLKCDMVSDVEELVVGFGMLSHQLLFLFVVVLVGRGLHVGFYLCFCFS